MERKPLGRTGLDVSVICLGTMTWGQQNTEAEGHEQMDYALERDINFFDAAEMYPIPPNPDTQGRTEKIIGTWFKARGNRDKVILASKICGRHPEMFWPREDGSKGTYVDASNIKEAIEKSLTRLQTDYIDLYQIHWPDRPLPLFGGTLTVEQPDVKAIPIEEQLRAFDDLVQEGKIRHLGVSNETPYGVTSFVKDAERLGLPRIQSIQNAYNLVNRGFEQGLAEACVAEDVSLLVYSPLAQGYLSGKYRNGALPEGSRKQLFDRLQRYETPYSQEAIEAYVDLAAEFDLDPSQFAIAFCVSRPFACSTIIGATTMDQLKLDIDAADVSLEDEILGRIQDIHRQYPNPCP